MKQQFSTINPPRSNAASASVARRSFFKRGLRATGALLTLPWMESLASAEETALLQPLSTQDGKPPVRFGCVYFSNGVEPEHWWAKKSPAAAAGGGQQQIQFGPGLAPLQQLADEITFIKGLYNEQAAKHPSPHMGRMANLLSGAWVSRDQSSIRVGKSMDQVLADEIGRSCEVPSLALGVEPTELRLEDGLSMIYGSCISWASPTKPATKEIYPARVYDLIMGSAGDRLLDRSILDAVVDDARRMQQTVSAADRVKLDEYFDSIRDIENRIDRARREERLEGWQPSATEPTFGRPPEALPQNVSEHMRLMLDLIVLAFQMNKTRIATCMLNNDLSQMNFGFLEGVEGSLHLDLTHNGRDPKLEAMYLKTNQFHVAQFRYLLERMRSIDEGGTSLLDNSILMLASNLFDGDRHEADEMPVLLAGSAGGAWKHGRIIDVRQSESNERRACNLYLSIMDQMGVRLPAFGDATQRLDI
ncbi:MAG: DUF1552 domain-containing protein [bacterium]|nr:DUF1552 domain-containing protein [bacterium]